MKSRWWWWKGEECHLLVYNLVIASKIHRPSTVPHEEYKLWSIHELERQSG